MPVTVATWNVNSVRKRLDQVRRFAHETAIDVLCLQETKVTNDLFPVEALTEAGFPYQAIAGMKGYNGVAILSRRPLVDVRVEPWLGRDDCRHVHARVAAGARPLEVHSLYVPAGGDDPDPEANPKFAHKLAFLDALGPFLAGRAASDLPVVVTGDLNVAPLETDVWSHERLNRVITHTPVERDKLKDLLAAKGGNGPDDGDGDGWTDALRRFVPPEVKVFTWWSYRAAASPGNSGRAADKGRRLDHIWVNAALAPALSFAAVHDEVRDWPEPSDHAPVRAVFEIP